VHSRDGGCRRQQIYEISGSAVTPELEVVGFGEFVFDAAAGTAQVEWRTRRERLWARFASAVREAGGAAEVEFVFEPGRVDDIAVVYDDSVYIWVFGEVVECDFGGVDACSYSANVFERVDDFWLRGQ
jgi:hypothetical protein